jgi:diaminopimelate epimerase
VVPGRCDGTGDQAEIRLPDVEIPVGVDGLPTVADERWLCFGTVGVPHLVVRVDDLEAVDLPRRGRALRFDPATGPDGANVNFVAPGGASGEPWRIRTYERGVEGETLACGTGTVAAAIALAVRGEAQLPLRFHSRGGPELLVRAELNGALAHDIWLGGQGRLLFRGVWEGV